MVLDVVVPCGTRREFGEWDGDPRAVGNHFYERFIRDVLRCDLYRFA